MTFETFRFMLQAYADQQKEPSSLPATIDTMACAYQRICQGEDPWTALGDFSNAWYGYARHIRPDLVKDPLARPEQGTDVVSQVLDMYSLLLYRRAHAGRLQSGGITDTDCQTDRADSPPG